MVSYPTGHRIKMGVKINLQEGVVPSVGTGTLLLRSSCVSLAWVTRRTSEETRDLGLDRRNVSL